MGKSLRTTAHALDHGVARLTGRRRVLFDALSPLNLSVLRPLMDALAGDPRVDVRVTSEGRDDIARAFERSGLTANLVSRDRVPWTRFDLYVNADPWNPPDLHRTAHRVNFFHGVAGKYDLDQPRGEGRPFNSYDRVAFINEDRLQRYLSAGVVAPTQAVLVGYPKLDVLVRGGYDAAEIRGALGFDPSRPTVMYAPTWSSASSLHLAGDAIIEALLPRGLNVIAKLHDNCFLPGEKYAGSIDWRARLARFRASGRFALVEAADACPYLAASDLLITDHSSIGFEYLVLDRPLVIFDAPDLTRVARINPEKVALLQSAGVVVPTAAALGEQIAGALANPECGSTQRRRVANQMFFRPGTATERALTLTYELLSLKRRHVPTEMRQAALESV